MCAGWVRGGRSNHVERIGEAAPNPAGCDGPLDGSYAGSWIARLELCKRVPGRVSRSVDPSFGRGADVIT